MMKNQSIFIVEDEIITARSIAKNIQKFGYQLAGIAGSGSEALTEIVTTKPDLVLMDILLDKNDIDGITTAERIQSQINIPVIYLTAHSDPDTLDRAKETFPFGYILKPYSQKALQISIEFALHKHQQELKLVKREELLSTILNTAQEGVIATDKTSKIIYMNPAAQLLTGWNFNEAVLRSASEVISIIDERTQQPIANPIEQVLEQGKILYLDQYAVLLQKDGGQRSIRDSVSPIIRQAPEGEMPTVEQIEGAVLIFASSQTSSLSELDPNQAATQTPVAEQQINELSAYLMDVVLHELRSPLTVILSTSRSLQKYRQRWTVEKQNNNLNRIQQAISQITRLLDDVAAWEELNNGQKSLQPDWIDVVGLSQELISNLRLIDHDNHQLTINLQSEETLFYLDPDVLRRILDNLLSNGLKYSPAGSLVSLSINCTRNRLILQVRDRGRGILQEEQSQIFQPFYRASNTESIRGTGLGLAIVREYVQLCGGEITLDSSLYSGSTFTVSFPPSEDNL